MKTRAALFFAAGVATVLVAIVCGVAFGSTSLAPALVVRVLAANVLGSNLFDVSDIPAGERAIVWAVRLPRVLVAALVGAGLAVAGAQMQGLFRNPLASPDVTGASAGAGLGAIIALASGSAARSIFYLPVFAFAGACLALAVVYLIATRRGRTPGATLLLAGVATGSLLTAASSFVITLRTVRYDVAGEIIFWLLGGLDSRTWSHVLVAAPVCVVGCLVALTYARELDLLTGGEEAAFALGVEVESVKRILLANAALLTGAAVAVSGVIGFVGLIVPHIARRFVGPAHRRLIPASALTGAAFLVFADLFARTINRPEEVRLGIITAACGAPFFLYLLTRERDRAGELG